MPAVPVGDVLRHQPAVHEDRVVLAGLEELGDALGHRRAPVAFDAERHAPGVARHEVADRPSPLQGDRDRAALAHPRLLVVTAEADDLEVVPGLQVREHRRRLDRPAAARLGELARREEQDPHSAGPIEQREDREDDRRAQDPGQPPGFERQPPQPLEPERSERAGGAALGSRPHVERATDADHDADRRERRRRGARSSAPASARRARPGRSWAPPNGSPRRSRPHGRRGGRCRPRRSWRRRPRSRPSARGARAIARPSVRRPRGCRRRTPRSRRARRPAAAASRRSRPPATAGPNARSAASARSRRPSRRGARGRPNAGRRRTRRPRGRAGGSRGSA